MGADKPLSNKTVVVTRPAQQAVSIIEQLSKLGANVIEYPLIAIDQPVSKQYKAQLAALSRYDYLIFTSRNAVEMAFSALAKLKPNQALQLPETLQVAAVGKQTAAALGELGVKVSIVPFAPFNSEALLAQPALQRVESKHIGIIRGEGGRELLGQTLIQRGAMVEYIDVYRRICPVDTLLPLVKCQQHSGIDIILLTSVEGLMNLFQLGANQAWLQQTTLLVGSQRIAEVAGATDHSGKIVVAEDPSDQQMVSELLRWAAG